MADIWKDVKIIGKIKEKNGEFIIKIVDLRGSLKIDLRHHVVSDKYTGPGKGVLLDYDLASSIFSENLFDKALSELDAIVSKKEKAIKKAKLKKK